MVGSASDEVIVLERNATENATIMDGMDELNDNSK